MYECITAMSHCIIIYTNTCAYISRTLMNCARTHTRTSHAAAIVSHKYRLYYATI